MVTLAGKQTNFVDALKEIVELDFDAIEAYDAAINRLNDSRYKAKLKEFKEDHVRHTKEITELLKDHGEDAPTGPSIGKQWLTKGKVVLANLIGDTTILRAMHSNEIDTNTAYERMNARTDKWEGSEGILRRALEDEIKHKKWLESEISSS